MKELVIKIVVFLTLFAMMLSFTDDAFKEKRISYHSRSAYKELNKNVDIAIFGSSHGLNAIDPRLIEKDLNKTVFNFSIAGQRIISTLPQMDEILTDNQVELAILDIFSGTVGSLDKSWDEKARFFQYNTLDNIDYSFSKINTHNNIYGLDEFFNMFPIVRRHHKWTDLVDGTTFLMDQNADFYNGYYARFRFEKKHWDKQLIENRNNINRDNIKLELDDEEKNNIDNVIQRFEDLDVPLLVISSPFYSDSLGLRSKSHQQLVVDYLKEKDVSFINFNELWDELKLKQHNFFNAGHLNTKGSLKVSSYLSEYIKENYTFNDNTLNDDDLLKNRYAILDNDYNDIIYYWSFDNIESVSEFGINKIFFFNAFKKRYEITLEMENASLDGIHLFYEYSFEDSEEKKIDKQQKSLIRDDGIVEQRLVPKTKLNYNNNAYQIYQFSSVFGTVKNFKLFVIKGEKRIEIINLAKLKLSDANR